MPDTIKWYEKQSAELGFTAEEKERFVKKGVYRSDFQVPRFERPWEAFGISGLVTQGEIESFKLSLPSELLSATLLNSELLGVHGGNVVEHAPATGVPYWLAKMYCLSKGGDLPSFEEIVIHHRRKLQNHSDDLFATVEFLHEKAKSAIANAENYYTVWCDSVPVELAQLGFGLFYECTRSMAVNPNWPRTDCDGCLGIPDTDHLSFVTTVTGVYSEYPYPGRFGRLDPRWLYSPPDGFFDLLAFRVAYRSL
jgi:hypothetical protein